MENWEAEQIKMAVRDSWEDEEVADSWDAEEEVNEEVVVTKVVETVKVSKPKKSAAVVESIEAEVETEQARKERMNRLIKESDLENAMALFGISKSEIDVDEVLEITKKEVIKKTTTDSTSSSGYFESAKPQTWSEFETLSTAIIKKFKSLETSKHYPNFLETLFRALLLDRDVPEIRKLSNMTGEVMQIRQKDKLAQINATGSGGKKKLAPSLVGATKKTGGRIMDFGRDDDDYDGF